MGYITTLLHVGGMLHVPIPRALVRELGLVKRARVIVNRSKEGGLRVELLDDYLRVRRKDRPSPAR